MHQRAGLDQGLEQLRKDLRRLASLVDIAIEKSVLSLARLDRAEAERVIEADKVINDLRYSVENAAIQIIAMQQPIAGDLRFVIAVLMVASELERMGDYCVGVAKITKLHGDRPLLKPLIDIPRMAEAVRSMLRGSVDALITKNAFLAEAIAAQDDEIDRLYDQIYRELLTYMLNDPTTIDRATWLLWAAHNMERIGDRVQNICERTVYEATGVLKEFGGRGGDDDAKRNDA
ncbi:MAG TPA: phosphate signaling complex protein PhoU [Candidatus Limnocylindria bacterium]